MGLAITNCVASRENKDIITDPTSATLNNQLTPSENITIAGGNRTFDLVLNAAYKIKGKVGENDRTFLNMKCTDTRDPAQFKKGLS